MAENTISYPAPVKRFGRPVRYISMNAMVGGVRGTVNGLQLHVLKARNERDLDAAFAEVAQRKTQA